MDLAPQLQVYPEDRMTHRKPQWAPYYWGFHPTKKNKPKIPKKFQAVRVRFHAHMPGSDWTGPPPANRWIFPNCRIKPNGKAGLGSKAKVMVAWKAKGISTGADITAARDRRRRDTPPNQQVKGLRTLGLPSHFCAGLRASLRGFVLGQVQIGRRGPIGTKGQRYFLASPMMRRCCRCRTRTVKRVKTARLSNTVAMMHDLRIVNAGGRQKWHCHDHEDKRHPTPLLAWNRSSHSRNLLA